MMKKENTVNKPTKTMPYDALLCPVSRNYLRRGDKVRMKDGEILTVRSLEFREFCAEEKIGYIPKKDIDTVMELNGA
jgi:hypothetical protein